MSGRSLFKANRATKLDVRQATIARIKKPYWERIAEHLDLMHGSFCARLAGDCPKRSRAPTDRLWMEALMSQLKGSKTEENLKAAFAGESQANRRYLYFAAKADVEGQNDVAALFRSTAEGETGHAHGQLEYMETVGAPAPTLPIGPTRANLKAAVAGETHEY